MLRTNRSALRCLLVLVAFIAIACGDKDARVQRITQGMTRDTVLSILQRAAPGAPRETDPNANIWRVARYLVDARNIEVIYFSSENEHWTAADSVPVKPVVPVIIIDGAVAGVGQGDYDRIAAQYRLPKVRY